MKIASLSLALLFSVAAAAHEHNQDAPTNPTFEKLKTLVGNWDGSGEDSGKKFATTTSFKMVSGNSVLMNTLAEGKPDEMITMFHLDQKDLLATHYCAAHNQPRMKAKSGASPAQITFEFKDGTNIGPNDGHMQRLVVTFVDNDHHTEDWVYLDKGKESTGHFDFHRKK
jgi:hypothetical protein